MSSPCERDGALLTELSRFDDSRLRVLTTDDPIGEAARAGFRLRPACRPLNPTDADVRRLAHLCLVHRVEDAI